MLCRMTSPIDPISVPRCEATWQQRMEADIAGVRASIDSLRAQMGNGFAVFAGRLDMLIANERRDTASEMNALQQVLTKEIQMGKELDDLTAAVAAEDTVIDSAVTLLSGLKAALDAAIASGNPAALTALSTDIGNKSAALSAAITANTPAATP